MHQQHPVKPQFIVVSSVLTSTKRLKKIAANRKIDTVGFGSSWGVVSPYFKAKEMKIDNKLFLGNISLGKVEIFGSDDLNFLSFIGNYLYGITGNVIFNNSILIIDRKNNKFGIIK
ncbi:MAG: hypothetical protein PF486_13780 [Prolixibacteraceae bacterium]|jgi:hypothetical protein|nr:hypothetical protein [Prolixibacteraceae bacterium]